MKVLHVITGIDRGGAENHLLDLVSHQRASGMEVVVAYLRGKGYWAATLRELGVAVHDLGLKFYGDLRPLAKLRRIIKGAEFDLIHAHLPPAELYSRLALLGLGVPLVISKHNEERFYDGPAQKVVGRWVGKRARCVIAISDAVKRFMSGAGLGLDPRKFETIHYGIDAAPFAKVPRDEVAALRDEWRIPAGALVVGFVGRLVAQKDIGTLLRGFARFSASDENARLVIVGEGALEASLRQLAEELGMAGRIVWAGFRSDIHRVMSAFDIFALTSTYEGLGLVLLEAMASQRPVVATRVGAIPEVVIDGRTGVLVGSGNPDELAAALQKLNDEALRTQLGTAGRQRVLQEFTLTKMCGQTDRVYAQSARRGKTPEAIPCAESTAN